MSKHTPGPWSISIGGNYICGDSLRWRETIICEVNMDHKRARANARLIAAAPDMLEACEQLIADADVRRGAYMYADSNVLDMIRAILARVEGGAK
jgi:hypothetical protein